MLVGLNSVVLGLYRQIMRKGICDHRFVNGRLLYHGARGDNFPAGCDLFTSDETMRLLLWLLVNMDWLAAWRSDWLLDWLDQQLLHTYNFITKSFVVAWDELVGSLCSCPSVLTKWLGKRTFTTSAAVLILVGKILNISLFTQDPQKFIFLVLGCSRLFFSLLNLVLLENQVNALLLRVLLLLVFCYRNTLPLFLTFYQQLSEFWLCQTLSFLVVRLRRLHAMWAFLFLLTPYLDGGLNLHGVLLRFNLNFASYLLDYASICWVSMVTALRNRSSVTAE